MASRDMFQVSHLRPERVLNAGSFAPNGASAIDNTQNEGSGASANTPGGGGLGTSVFSVARSGTGTYVVTFSDPYSAIEAFLPYFQATAGIPSTGALTLSAKTSNTATLVYTVAGTLTDITAAGSTRVGFVAVCRNSSII